MIVSIHIAFVVAGVIIAFACGWAFGTIQQIGKTAAAMGSFTRQLMELKKKADAMPMDTEN